MIRVVNMETNQRALIKDMKGLVQDVSFALTPNQVLLGFVDEEGNLFVYNIHDKPQSIGYVSLQKPNVYIVNNFYDIRKVLRVLLHIIFYALNRIFNLNTNLIKIKI